MISKSRSQIKNEINVIFFCLIKTLFMGNELDLTVNNLKRFFFIIMQFKKKKKPRKTSLVYLLVKSFLVSSTKVCFINRPQQP